MTEIFGVAIVWRRGEAVGAGAATPPRRGPIFEHANRRTLMKARAKRAKAKPAKTRNLAGGLLGKGGKPLSGRRAFGPQKAPRAA